MTIRVRRLRHAALALLGLLSLWLIVLGFQISAAGQESASGNADVAIVLGAGVQVDRPSPVFDERIRHGVTLYRTGRVKMLLMTGGALPGGHPEALVARARAIELRVPAEAIRVETVSRTTQQNMVEARRVMQDGGLRTALIVSDPLHMKRALRMSAGLGIEAAGSPTPTTMIRSRQARAQFLLREMLFYNVYLLTGR